MKKVFLSTVALVAMAASASAADLAARPYTKASPMMVAPAYDWSGFYIGLNGGGGSSHKCWDITADPEGVYKSPLAEGCHNATGGTFGGQIGYRWQSAAWVFGVEAQGNWANFKGSNVNLQASDLYDQSRVDAFGLFTGQVGYAWNNALLYVKGGAAVVSDKYGTYNLNGFQNDAASETRWGGVIGVGLEYGFTPNWSFAVEYDHMFMGTNDNRFYYTPNNPPPGWSSTDRISQDVDLFTVRLNYKFGVGKGPVVARY
jgi:outer membrane immunogenic protein